MTSIIGYFLEPMYDPIAQVRLYVVRSVEE